MHICEPAGLYAYDIFADLKPLRVITLLMLIMIDDGVILVLVMRIMYLGTFVVEF